MSTFPRLPHLSHSCTRGPASRTLCSGSARYCSCNRVQSHQHNGRPTHETTYVHLHRYKGLSQNKVNPSNRWFPFCFALEQTQTGYLPKKQYIIYIHVSSSMVAQEDFTPCQQCQSCTAYIQHVATRQMPGSRTHTDNWIKHRKIQCHATILSVKPTASLCGTSQKGIGMGFRSNPTDFIHLCQGCNLGSSAENPHPHQVPGCPETQVGTSLQPSIWLRPQGKKTYFQ